MSCTYMVDTTPANARKGYGTATTCGKATVVRESLIVGDVLYEARGCQEHRAEVEVSEVVEMKVRAA